MPVFLYTAFSENGALVKGECAALSVGELTGDLAAQGLLLQQAKRKRIGVFGRRQRIKSDQFLLFNQEFMALVRAGLTIPEALKLATDRPGDQTVGRILRRVLNDVREGVSFPEACRRHPEMFDGLYVAALHANEKGGNLVEALVRYQRFLQQRVEMQKKVAQALIYPSFLLVVLVVVLAALFVFVLPRFVAMYADFNAQLPLPTRVLIELVNGLPIYGPLLIAAMALGAGAWRVAVATDKGQLWLERVKERLPLWGSVHKHLGIARTARTLETLLSGGTPLLEALRTCRHSFSDKLLIQRLEITSALVIEGKSLAHAFGAAGVMPDTAIKMIEVGEASGELTAMLGEIARFYEERVATLLTRFMTLLEPALMLLIGVMIGGIIIVMYLPIFYIADVVR